MPLCFSGIHETCPRPLAAEWEARLRLSEAGVGSVFVDDHWFGGCSPAEWGEGRIAGTMAVEGASAPPCWAPLLRTNVVSPAVEVVVSP